MTRLQADGLLLLVALIWGSAFVAQSWGMASVGPLTFTGVRFLVGALLVLPLALHELKGLQARRKLPQGNDLLHIGALGGLLAVGSIVQQIGLLDTSVTHASFLTVLYVPLVPLVGWVLLHERPHRGVWPCALASLAGTWLLSGADTASFSRGDVWVMSGALPWALHVAFVGRVAQRTEAPFTVAVGQFLVCGFIAMALAAAQERVSFEAIWAARATIGYTGLLSVGFAFTAQVVTQRHTQSADAAIILSSETVFAAVCGALLMGDRISVLGWLGCALMLASIVIVQCLPAALPSAGSQPSTARPA